MVVKNNNLAVFLVFSAILHTFLVFWPHQNQHSKPKKRILTAQIIAPVPTLPPKNAEWIVPKLASEQQADTAKKLENFQSSLMPTVSKNALIKKTWKDAIFEKIEEQKNAGLFYPKTAVLQGLEGVAEVMIFLDSEGTVLAVRLQTTSGHTILDEAALRAARALKSLPREAPTEILLPIVFRLE